MITCNEIQEVLKDIPQQALRELWSSNTKWTNAVKEKFTRLGQNKGFYVCTTGVPADHGEWLYDLVWLNGKFTDDGMYHPSECALVMESEWGSHFQVIDDFSKLLVSSSKFRIMVCQPSSQDMEVKYLEEMKRMIQKFSPKVSGTKYIFIFYEEWNRKFSCCEYITP